MERIWVVYETTNNINGKKYIGKTYKNNIKNGYKGSGVYFLKSLKKYGKENFSTKILFEFSSEKESLEKEKKLISELNCCYSDEYYNIHPGGEGGNPFGKTSNTYGKKIHDENFKKEFVKNTTSKEAMEKREKTYEKNFKKYGKKLEPDVCKRRSEIQKTDSNAKSVPVIITFPNGDEVRYPSIRQAGEKSGFRSVLLRSALRNKKELPEGFYVRFATSVTTTGGVHFNNNSGKKISNSNKGKKKTKTEKLCKSYKENGKLRIGKKWINKDGINKLIKEEEISDFLNLGWSLGLLHKKRPIMKLEDLE